jgi:hypothetical protein
MIRSTMMYDFFLVWITSLMKLRNPAHIQQMILMIGNVIVWNQTNSFFPCRHRDVPYFHAPHKIITTKLFCAIDTKLLHADVTRIDKFRYFSFLFLPWSYPIQTKSVSPFNVTLNFIGGRTVLQPRGTGLNCSLNFIKWVSKLA